MPTLVYLTNLQTIRLTVTTKQVPTAIPRVGISLPRVSVNPERMIPAAEEIFHTKLFSAVDRAPKPCSGKPHFPNSTNLLMIARFMTAASPSPTNTEPISKS